ncbi:MAG: flagellar biosynthetic protein FliR [Oscillospiraceae bacterium]|jgi:flagellar biosynthetic protein FliR|nr:flagellar biosynthetic protein FliR [Oscillospiraceae bacterium]
MINISINNFFVYFLVFVRMIGILGFNPIFNQRSIPAMARTGLAVAVTVLLAPTVPLPEEDFSGILYFVALFKELLIGFILAHVCMMFYYLLMAMGEILDMQIGLSMAKVMDPATNIQMGVTDKLLNFLFITMFFVTNCHLMMFRLIFTSYEAVPIGVGGIDFSEIGSYGIEIFIDTFAMALKIAVPIVLAEFLLEIGLGILMKLIPAIHIFVINLQMKISLGIILLFVLASPISEFIDKYLVNMFNAMRSSLNHLS